MSLIRDINSTLPIPILTRYFVESDACGDYTQFVSVLKALTAFFVLRRGATSGTAGIDEDYRKLMRQGHSPQDACRLSPQVPNSRSEIPPGLASGRDPAPRRVRPRRPSLHLPPQPGKPPPAGNGAPLPGRILAGVALHEGRRRDSSSQGSLCARPDRLPTRQVLIFQPKADLHDFRPSQIKTQGPNKEK